MNTSLESIALHRKSIPTFLKKTYQILNVRPAMQDETNQDTVQWAPNGIGFIVLNEELFAQNVLPKYFKHNKYTSFVRQVPRPMQLNMYNFHKIRDSNSESYFYHDCFDRACEGKLALIHRKPEHKKAKDCEHEEPDSHEEESVFILEKVDGRRKRHPKPTSTPPPLPPSQNSPPSTLSPDQPSGQIFSISHSSSISYPSSKPSEKSPPPMSRLPPPSKQPFSIEKYPLSLSHPPSNPRPPPLKQTGGGSSENKFPMNGEHTSSKTFSEKDTQEVVPVEWENEYEGEWVEVDDDLSIAGEANEVHWLTKELIYPSYGNLSGGFYTGTFMEQFTVFH